MLTLPEPGLDDTTAYQGYTTRFFRDSKRNAVQVYLDPRAGRVVHLWADAANASVGLTARDAAGRPARLAWGSGGAAIADSGAVRTVEYRLASNATRLEVGWFLLGSMRVERDFQYSRRHLEPFGAPRFRLRELDELIASLERLGPGERQRHLALVPARSIAELRTRLHPTITGSGTGARRVIRVEQPSFDGRNRLALELRVDPREAVAEVTGRTVSIRSRSTRPIVLALRMSTDAASLTPLDRDEIFSPDFLQFVARARAAHDSMLRIGGDRGADPAVLRSRWLDRQVRSFELLSSREKLMAGLPNFATYFGRDMLMTALMMRPIWSESMSEHVIASVLRKLSPSGQVSHEEALGGQAIRENAAEYAALVAEHIRLTRRGEGRRADSALVRARAILGDLQAMRENYNMLDDELQFPVLAARYLADSRVSATRKRAFLMDSSDGNGSRLALLLRELGLVTRLTAPYARDPAVEHLIAFPKRDSIRWFPGSWRDSGAGYANGRFALDVNAIWAPHALQAIAEILASLDTLGITSEQLRGLAPAMVGTPLGEYARDPASLRQAVERWTGAARHFVVALTPVELRERIDAKLRSLPPDERTYWERTLATEGAAREPLELLALSLDATGRPVAVANTDPAMGLFLGDPLPEGAGDTARVLRDVAVVMRPYPVGLFVAGLGAVVANDAYAAPAVWEAFREDLYHSPRVVWGREVNLFLLGLANRIAGAVDSSGRPLDPALASYVSTLEDALRRTRSAVEASGLKHSELWSYRIEEGGNRLVPIRYGSTSDIQLWNLTDLAVQFALARLPRP